MEAVHTIDPATTIGMATLTVADLARSLDFYQEQIGLGLQDRDTNAATLGSGSTPLLRLQELAGARPVRRATGLFHFALLVPSRRELARTLAHLLETKTPIDGASDHHVSEALYLHDPDGHGIEIYRDRPRSDWTDASGQFLMNTTPFDADGVMAELAGGAPPWQGLHPDTVMGHIHLRVDNLENARAFYVGVLGFEVMAEMDSALFISAGGYHHHLGMNTWAGVGIPAPPADAARLLSYEMRLPDAAALDAVLARLDAAGHTPIEQVDAWFVRDPAQNGILLRA